MVAEIFNFKYFEVFASALMEILLRMGNKPRFGRSGKIGWARLTDMGSKVPLGPIQFIPPSFKIVKMFHLKYQI